MTRHEPSRYPHVIGRMVMRAATLEVSLVELIIRLASDAGEDVNAARVKWSGSSGKAVIAELRRRGKSDLADEYASLAEDRNHLIHGVLWERPGGGGGAHVIQQPRSEKSNAGPILAPPSRRVWTVDEILVLSRRIADLADLVHRQVAKDGYWTETFMISSELSLQPNGEWV